MVRGSGAYGGGVAPDIREYVDADAAGWLRCGVLSCSDTQDDDDVLVERPQFAGPAVRLVAERHGTVAGPIDGAIDGAAATIESIGVLPEHRGGDAARPLLLATIERLPATVRTLDAWTREMPVANAWYHANGFVDQFRSVHGCEQRDEPDVVRASAAGSTGAGSA